VAVNSRDEPIEAGGLDSCDEHRNDGTMIVHASNHCGSNLFAIVIPVLVTGGYVSPPKAGAAATNTFYYHGTVG
jgi:hypothetical protein